MTGFTEEFRMAMARKNEQTSKNVGKVASALLRNRMIGKNVKSVAGSALTQRPDHKQK